MKYAINLFPSRRSILSILSNFMVYYLRYALVLTLFVVVIIFFLRMQVDQKLVDEQSKMSQKKAIVLATEGMRGDLQVVQDKVKDINNLLLKQDAIVEITNYVTKIVPAGMDVGSLTVTSSDVSFTATTTEYRKIQSIQKRLQKDGKFEKIDVGGISRDKGGVYSLTVSLTGWNKIENSTHNNSQIIDEQLVEEDTAVDPVNTDVNNEQDIEE